MPLENEAHALYRCREQFLVAKLSEEPSDLVPGIKSRLFNANQLMLSAGLRTRTSDAAFPVGAGNTFDEWVRYPVSAGLIEAKDEQVTITEVGREFLGYMDALGLSESTRPW